jgi:hypothetical protein
MSAKSNKALRRSARLARRAPVSAEVALPAARAFPRHPWLRVGVANGVAAAVAGVLWGSGGAAFAQEQAPAAAVGGESLQEVVVTASAQGVKKLDASYNIVAADTEAIKEANPKSSADILKLSPGIWPESSGGQTGANIEVAGFPSGGDAPFFTNMIEGLPMYGMPSLSFMDSSSLFRLDDTIQRVEVVQGGPAAVLGPAQMGATANYLLRTGTDQPTGSAGVTYGNEGLWRMDVFSGFKIADGWYGSVGGFYRRSDGVRSPQFAADVGGQFTATLKHDLDGGSLLIWARALDDKNQFIVPVPVVQSATGSSFSDYPGFCALKCSYGSKAIQNVTIPNPAGGFENADLANGRGGNLYYFGVKWDQKFGDWSLLNNFMIDGGGLDTNALFSGPNPRPLSYYLYGCQVAQPAGYCNLATAIDSNNLGPNGQGLSPALNVSATYAGSGVAVSPSQSVLTQGWWFIQKSLENIVDEFRVSRMIFTDNTLTGGVYLTKYTMNDNWSLGNTMLMANTPNTTAINLSYLTGADCATPGTTNVCHITSPQGFVSFNNNYNILQHGNATNVAGYLSDSWKIGPWLVDVGARLEKIDARQRTCNRSPQQLGSIFDLWDAKTPICNGTFDYEHYTTTRPTFTGGANYEFSSNMSAYVRANTGVHFDDFDNGIRGAGGKFAPLQTVTNYEGGFKFQAPWAYLDVSVYHRDFTGLQYQETNSVGVGTGVISTYGATTKGVDFIGVLTPLPGLNLRLVGDYEDGTYKDYVGCAKYTDILGNPQCAQINGQPLQRQPKFQIRVTPSYTLPGPWGDATAWVTYEHVGQRYEDQSGLQPLGSYYMLGAGILANLGTNWQFRVQGTNLTNQIALTEGNARKFGQATGIGGVILARPIEGREIAFTAYYKF